MVSPAKTQRSPLGASGAQATEGDVTAAQDNRAPTNATIPPLDGVKAVANTDQLSSHVLPPLTKTCGQTPPPVVGDTAESVSTSPSIRHGLSLLKAAAGASYRFIRRAVGEEWMAAPISFAASLPSNVLTGVTVVALSPGLEKLFGGADTAGYTVSTSFAAVVIGYASYLALYWGGMLFKERKDLFSSDGRFVPDKLTEKLKVMRLDFLLHLPNDIFTMATTGVAQGGLYASGASSLFWSIFLSQTAIDLVYSVREPFYWRLAKDAAEWHRKRSTKVSDAGPREASNSDVEERPQNNRRAAN